MRGAGISSAGIDSDLGGMEDTTGDEAPAIDGGAGAGPETSTGGDLGAEPAPTAQTV